MSIKVLSIFLTPCCIDSVITGKVIKTDTNIGTCEEPNQSKAIKINDTTGVDLIMLMIGIKAILNVRDRPDEKPNIKDIPKDIKKATMPRINVAMRLWRKEGFVNKTKASLNTLIGSGSINCELKYFAPNSQKISKIQIEMLTITNPFCFISNKIHYRVVYFQ